MDAAITEAQATYLTNLRDNLAQDTKWTLRAESPIGAIPRLCRTIARLIETGRDTESATRIGRAPWLATVLQDTDTTAESIADRIIALRSHIASLTDSEIAALPKDTASTFISAAKALA